MRVAYIALGVTYGLDLYISFLRFCYSGKVEQGVIVFHCINGPKIVS